MKRIIALGIMLIIGAVLIAGCMPKEIRTIKIELGTRQKPKANPDLDRVKMNLTKAEKNYPNNAEVYYLWGWVHSKEGNYVEMDKAFNMSMEISDAFKTDADTIRMEKWDELINEADLARQEEEFEKALKAFESCIVCWPYRYEPFMFGGDCAFRIGQLEKAYDMSKKAYEIVPDSLNAVKLYADMCRVNQKHDEALAVFQKLIDKNPTDANILYRIGDIYLERGDTVKVLEMYNKALEFDSDNPDAWLNVALLYFSLKDFCKASEKFERYVALEPDNIDNNFLYLLATYQCVKTDEDLTKLKGDLEKFTMDNPDHCESWQLLANTYLKLKMKKEAIAANEKLDDCQKPQPPNERRERFIKDNPKLSEKVRTAIFNGEIFIGMTDKQVKASLGTPKDINRTTTEYGINEQWIYEKNRYKDKYLYFENGKLTTIQD